MLHISFSNPKQQKEKKAEALITAGCSRKYFIFAFLIEKLMHILFVLGGNYFVGLHSKMYAYR